METRDELSQLTPPPDAAAQSQIGVDQWVAEAEGRRMERSRLRRTVDAVPSALRLVGFVALASAIPFLLSEGNLYRYGLYTLIYALLGLGLNVTVGFAGLLDLGYVAFYGIGAYMYAILASPHFDIHWQAQWAIPVAVTTTALFGLALGLNSRRLLGDYLAIITLFFGQAFVVFANAANPKGLTGGANGIAGIDPLNFFGYKLTTTKQYYYLTLTVFVAVVSALFALSRSRTGRSWMALREDPLAAELMGIPVNRLKIMAFVFGASIAGLTGTIFAANQTGVFPGDFDTTILITIYAVLILGGIGSLTGTVVGAIVINVSFEILTPATPDRARELFYVAIVLALAARVRPWQRLAVLTAGVVGLGFAIHAVVHALDPSATRGAITTGGFLTHAIRSWVIVPEHPGKAASYAYIGLIAAVLAMTRLRGWWRIAIAIPTVYLIPFVWENLLIQQPAVTRLILFGALLIALMTARPQGLLGTARVEIA